MNSTFNTIKIVGKKGTSCTIVHFDDKGVKVCFLFIGGTFLNEWINQAVVSPGQQGTLALNVPSVYHRVEKAYLDLGEVSVSYLGATVWDMLFVGDANLYKAGLSGLVDIAQRHSKFIVLRSVTPMGYPLKLWQGTSRAVDYHQDAEKYREVILGFARSRVAVVDMYDVLHTFQLEHPSLVWREKGVCELERASFLQQCENGQHDVKTCAKKALFQCGNYVHMYNVTGGDDEGFLSVMLSQAILQIFIRVLLSLFFMIKNPIFR